MTSKKNDTVIISIKPVEKRTAKIRIVGDSSLIVHAWSEKARKEFENWYADVLVTYNANLCDLDTIINLIALGGDQCGLGEWRIEKGGSHGAFHVGLTE